MTRPVYLQTASAIATAVVYGEDDREYGEEWFAANPLYTIRLIGRVTSTELSTPSVYVYKIAYRAKKANRDDLSRRFRRAFGSYGYVEPSAAITDKVPYAPAS